MTSTKTAKDQEKNEKDKKNKENKENQESQEKLIDSFSLLKVHSIKLFDDGFVRLVDISPRLCPQGRTPEFAIVRNARISYGLGLKSISEDIKLIRYLVKNQHTSPLEGIQITYHLRVPKFVSIQILRHRTGKYNEFSQRYSEIKDDSFFHPSKVQDGIRLAPKTKKEKEPSGEKVNKQGSDIPEGTVSKELCSEIQNTEELIDQLFQSYHKMIQLGLAKEVARFCLPMATYTEIYMTMDLNNLIKFFKLRCDSHSQLEIQTVANAMRELILPLVPITLEATGL